MNFLWNSLTDYCFFKVFGVLLLLKVTFELILLNLNERNLKRHQEKVPEVFRDFIDESRYFKSIPYNVDKIRFGYISHVYSALVLTAVILTGLLPALWDFFNGLLNLEDAFGALLFWGQALFLFTTVTVMSWFSIPFDLYSQFVIEEKHGFNKMTAVLWVVDAVKSFFVSAVLVIPLAALIFFLVSVFPRSWWLIVFAVVFIFQLIMMVLYPLLIMPLFNKFTPLEDGTLRERFFKLARRCSFPAGEIYVMDGSKRSSHSNAFFTGFGKFRRIVLFDTLVEQLDPNELEGVLAHEIGHNKKGHIPRLLALSGSFMLVMFFVLFQLTHASWFTASFGFGESASLPVLSFVLFGVIGGVFSYWITPLNGLFSRRYEYQADRYAAEKTGSPDGLTSALKKLSEKNLSLFTPHPLYSMFYYSHPTLKERIKALKEISNG